ncbi:LamG domain-containing protein [Candidatus Woesearchaeota archaeon]|nr:LamG domain-containing protein [Candidatus Woesearchaeota archaeon]
MTDPYTKLFAPEDTGTANIAGFALNAGAATVGTNPGKFVYLGFDTVDSYSPVQNDSVIINQAICWAATGAYNCAPARTINTLSNATPFFTNLTNPYNLSLSQDESLTVTFWLNASGTIGRYHEVFLIVNKTSESSVSNATRRYNITISSSNTGPTVTIASPNDGIFTSDTGLDINYVASSDTLSRCWYTNESNTGNITLAGCANITDVVWPEGIHNLTIYANDSTGQSSDTVSFIVDTTNPLISVNIPRNSSYSNDAGQDINYSVSDTYLASCWYSNDTYSVNTTLASCANITSLNWATGMHNVTIWANDSAGNKNSTIVFFTIDITSPLLTINYPSNSSFISDASASVNYSVSDTNLASCWYSNDTYSKNTTLANCANITGLSWAEGKHNLTVWANDSGGNTNSTIVFFTIDTLKPSVAFNPASFQSQAPQSLTYIYVNVSSSDTNDNFKFVDFDNDLLLWLRMDNVDGSGNPADSSSYALTLNSSNNTGQNSSGRFGKAFNFNGSGFFTLQRPVRDSFSICTWIKTNVKGGSANHWQLAPIIESECSFADNDFGFGIDKFGYVAIGTGPDDITINSTTNVSDNNWHFVCGARNLSSGNLSVYVDGNFEKAKNSSTTSLTCNSLATIGFGTDGASYFSGLMDELLIWNRTLSSAEISAIYNFSTTSPNYLNNFTGLADRNHSATAYSVDAAGNINSTSSYILVDTIAPSISILSPSNNSFTANYQASVNYSGTDSYLASCWYSNDTYSVNTTLASCANITGLSLADGQHNVTIYANDTAGNINSSIIYFTIDTTRPSLKVLSPGNESFTKNSYIELNFSMDEINIEEFTYTWNGSNFTLFNDSLVLMMNFDNVSALGENITYVVDHSKYNNNGVLIGSAYPTTDGKYNGGWRFYTLGDSLNLGSDSSIDFGGKTHITIALWANVSQSTSDDNKYVFKGNQFDFQVQNSLNDRIRFEVNNGSWQSCITDNNVAEIGSWAHYAATYNGSQVKIYKNAELVKSCSISGEFNSAGDSQPLCISATSSCGGQDAEINGTIDELMIWDTELNAQSIYQLYVSNLRKYQTDKWLLYVNQSRNATHGLLEDVYSYSLYANDTVSNTNTTSQVTRIDLSAPISTLILPVDGGGDHDGNVTFTYNVSDTGPVSNCTLILNSALNQTNVTITKDAPQYIILSNLKAGRYNWSVNCTDQLGRSNISSTWNFRIINATKFGGVTTDLNSYNLSNVTALIIEQLSRGKINFTVPIDMSNVTEIDTYVNISANLIEVNSTALSQLNVTAVLTLYNLSFTNPRIMRDNAVCSTGICSKLSYSGGNLTFNVSHFSSYSAEETPTVSTPAAASGGGGGGGSSSGIYITTLANNLFINFRQDREYKIYIKNRYYDTRLLIQTQGHIVMQIGSYVLTLKKGNRQYLDVDNDGTYDLDVILLETSGNIATRLCQRSNTLKR